MSNDTVERLKGAVEGLTYPSESDERFDVVHWDNPQCRDAADVLEAKVGKGRKLRAVPPKEFFTALREADDADRYESLRRLMQSIVRELKIFRVGEGEVRVDVYLVGLATADCTVVGVHTVSIET